MQDDKQSQIINKVTTIALMVFIASWILPENFNNLAIILCSLLWIIYKGYKSIRLNNFFVLWSIFFCVVFSVSILYSADKSEAVTLTERKLLLPVVLVIFPVLLSKVERILLLRTYVISWFLLTIYSLAHTLLKHGIEYNNISYFSWLLPQSTELASTYLGIFTSFALIILLWDLQTNSLFQNSIVTASLILYFFLYLIILSARMPLFATLIVIILYPVFCLSNWSKKTISIYALSVIVLSATLMMLSPFLRDKMVTLLNKNDPRFFEFQAGAQVVRENFLTGVGVGDIQNHLDEAYQKSGFQHGIEEGLNVHNEFLHDTMAVGVVGLFLMVSVTITCFWKAFQARNFLQFGFAVLFFSCCITEVILNRQKGITFFAFFICLLYIVPIDEKSTSR